MFPQIAATAFYSHHVDVSSTPTIIIEDYGALTISFISRGFISRPRF